MKFMYSLILIICIHFCASVEAQESLFTGESKDFLEKNMDVFECSGFSYDWIKKGKLYKYVATRSSRHISYFKYVTIDGSTEIFTDSTLASVSEILEKEAIQDFDIKVVKKVVKGLVLRSMSSRHDTLIDKHYLDEYGHEVATESLPNKDLLLLKELFKENGNEDVKILGDKNKWQARFYSITLRGGVECWSICGSTNPLDVESVERKIIFKNNKVKVLEFY